MRKIEGIRSEEEGEPVSLLSKTWRSKEKDESGGNRVKDILTVGINFALRRGGRHDRQDGCMRCSVTERP